MSCSLAPCQKPSGLDAPSPYVRTRLGDVQPSLLGSAERKVLEESRWFARLGHDARRDLLRYLQVRRLKHGAVVHRPFTDLYRLDVVVNGAVKLALNLDGAPGVRFLGPGAWLVDPAMYGGQARLHHVVIHRSATLGSIGGDDLRAIVGRHPGLEDAIQALSFERVSQGLSSLHEENTLKIGQRLAKRLLELVTYFGHWHLERVRIKVRLRQDELAEMVGCCRTRLNAELKSFEARGILLAQREIVVIDMAALGEIAASGEVALARAGARQC